MNGSQVRSAPLRRSEVSHRRGVLPSAKLVSKVRHDIEQFQPLKGRLLSCSGDVVIGSGEAAWVLKLRTLPGRLLGVTLPGRLPWVERSILGPRATSELTICPAYGDAVMTVPGEATGGGTGLSDRNNGWM